MGVVELRLSGEARRVLLGAVRREARRLELEIEAALERVKRLEERRGMSSEEFLERFLRGELGDEEEFIEWYGELVFLERAKRELEELRRVERLLSEEIRGEG